MTNKKEFFQYTALLNTIAEAYECRESWGKAFARKEIEESFKDTIKKVKNPLVLPNGEHYDAIRPLLECIQQRYQNKKVSDDMFCKDVFFQLEKLHVYLSEINFLTYEKEELYNLGFGNWDEKTLLIPLYVYRALPNGTELVSISGEKVMIGKDDIQTDIRFGCISYGFDVSLLNNK